MHSIFWFRRDLRLFDNAGLYHALKDEVPVKCIFIFDRNILHKLPEQDARVEFIYDEILKLKDQLRKHNSDLHIYYGEPLDIWKNIIENEDVKSIYFNRDYEVYAKDRDLNVRNMAIEKNVDVFDYKDQVIFDGQEVAKDDGDPYVVFTPYKRKWLETLESGRHNPMDTSKYIASYPVEQYIKNLADFKQEHHPTLDAMGFKRTGIPIPDRNMDLTSLKDYGKTRDFPSLEGTSKLGIHLRFGTISIRALVRNTLEISEVFVSELIWRDFYSNILDHYPYVTDSSFREKYENIAWRDADEDFEKWCRGMTGYAIVDAGMRELNATGYMHNRVRMITASFLTKHLMIHWKRGERYFAEKLLDYDLASNNGGWQWAAGTGTDAAPYFRIFNPYTQIKKFDKDLEYIKKWVPEYGTHDYVQEIVPHKAGRERALEMYKQGLDSN